MTGGYLKQLQLTKQLEEQAKKAAKNREAAEKKIDEADRLIASAKQMGAEVAVAQKLLVEANELFSKKDFNGALGQAAKALEEARETKGRTVTAILTTAEDLIKQMNGTQAETREPLGLVSRSRDLMGEDKLDEAFAVAKEAWDKTEQHVNARMADGFERAHSLMLLAEGEGLKTESEREILGQARKSLERSEYTQSIEQLGSCLESVSESLSNRFHTRMRGMEVSMTPARDLGMDLSKIGDMLQKASERLDAGSIEDAFSHLTIADGEFRKVFSKGMLSVFDRLGDEIALLERYDETDELAPLISQGRDLTRAGEFDKAIEVYGRVRKEAGEKQLQALMRQILRLRPKIQIARRVGSNIQKPLEQLQASRTAMQGGDFGKAMDLVHRADSLLEEELKGFREMERELAVTEGLVSLGERFAVERTKALEMMRKARGLALVGSIDRSLEQLRAAQKSLHRGIQQHLGSEIMRIELSLAAAMRMGADVTQESALIDDIMARVKSGDYMGVEAPLADCHQRVKQQLRVKAEHNLESSRKALRLYHQRAETTSARLMIEEAETALKAEDFEKAFGLAQGAIQEMEGNETSLLESGLVEARRLLEICRQLGGESSTLNDRLAEVERLRLDSETKAALGALEELLQLAGTLVKEETREGLTSLAKDISSARKRGVEMIGVERMAEEISRLIDQEKVADAFEILAKAEERLSSTIGKHKEVSGYMQEIASLVEEAHTGRIEISGPGRQLEKISALFETGDYDGALELAGSTLKEAETLVAPLVSVRKVKETEGLLATARRLKQNVSEEESALTEARSQLEKKDYISALGAAKGAARTAEGKIREGLRQELESTRELMARAEEGGKDVISLSQIIDKAQGLLEQGKTNDALRAVGLVQRELDQGMLVEKRATEGIERAAHVLTSVGRIGVKSAGAEEMLRQAKEQAQMGRSGIALELAKKVADQAAEAARDMIGERLRNLELNYEAMKLEGPDLSRVLRLRSEIKEKMEQWRFPEAHSLLESIDEELERVGKQKELSEKTVEELEKRVERARGKGLTSRKVEEYLGMARTSLSQGAFVTAFSHATRCSDELHSLEDMYDRRAEELLALRSQLRGLEGEDLNIASVTAFLDDAERSLGRLEFQETSLNLKRGTTALSKLVSELAVKRRARLRSLTELARDIGMEGRTAGDLGASWSAETDPAKLIAAIEGLRVGILGSLERRREELTGRIQMARNSGADTLASEQMLGQAASALEKGDMNEAYLMLKESEASIGVAMEVRKEYMETRLRCESLIENARRNGLVMNDVIGIFQMAERRRESDYQDAIAMMRSALERATEEAAAYLPELAVDIDFLDEPAVGRWTRARLNIRNDGKAMARDIETAISGEIEMRGLQGLRKLRGGESVQADFEIMPKTQGKMEVSFSLSCRPVLSDDEFGFDSSFELDVK